jgi:hypothetical protein
LSRFARPSPGYGFALSRSGGGFEDHGANLAVHEGILTQFLVERVESIVMGILGGAAGLVLGITSAKVLAHFTGSA